MDRGSLLGGGLGHGWCFGCGLRLMFHVVQFLVDVLDFDLVSTNDFCSFKRQTDKRLLTKKVSQLKYLANLGGEQVH